MVVGLGLGWGNCGGHLRFLVCLFLVCFLVDLLATFILVWFLGLKLFLFFIFVLGQGAGPKWLVEFFWRRFGGCCGVCWETRKVGLSKDLWGWCSKVGQHGSNWGFVFF